MLMSDKKTIRSFDNGGILLIGTWKCLIDFLQRLQNFNLFIRMVHLKTDL